MYNSIFQEQQRENFSPCASQSGPEEGGKNQHLSLMTSPEVSLIRRKIIIFKDKTGSFGWILLLLVLTYPRREHSSPLLVQKPCIGRSEQVKGAVGRAPVWTQVSAEREQRWTEKRTDGI